MTVHLEASQVKPELVDIETLRPHPANPRNGDLELLGESVRRHGVFRTIVVSSDNVILAGNHTYMAAMGEGEQKLWISRMPFPHTDRQATEIMLVDNRGADAAQYDDAQLATVLATLDGDLDGTGYDGGDLKKLLEKLDEDTSAQLGATEYKIMIDCDSEQHQAELLAVFEQQGLKVKALAA